MRLPRDISGVHLAKVLKPFGYNVTRQTGSHLRLTTQQRGEHHVTIPNHDPLRTELWLESSRTLLNILRLHAMS